MLQLFQDGYTKREIDYLDEYMDKLFSKENILILGTMPSEYLTDHSSAKSLIKSDWLYWGDVKLLINNSNISSYENVAWFSTIGYVEFDLFRYLVVPLRISGVLVKEEPDWKFQQVQYQFDLDSSMVLMTVIFLILIFAVSLIRFLFIVVRYIRKKG